MTNFLDNCDLYGYCPMLWNRSDFFIREDLKFVDEDLKEVYVSRNVQAQSELTESIPVWEGSGGRYLESPHLYHIGDWYYLMVAEGGTEYGHMITYARSKEPFGPFEGYQRNPMLTNRNLGGNQNVIQGIGHGDLIQDEKGDYFLVCLGFRQSGEWQPYHHLGREVFLAPVYWHDGRFTAGEHGILKLRGTAVTLEQADTPTFIGVRQSEFDTNLCVTVSGEAMEAGITFYMDENEHYDLALVQDGSMSIPRTQKVELFLPA